MATDRQEDREPDYGDEERETEPQLIDQLNALVGQMAVLHLHEQELEDELTEIREKLKVYRENLIPEVMSQMRISDVTTNGGLRVTMKNEVRASFPRDAAKRAAAFEYLRRTGNDGIIKRMISIEYGRDSTEMAEKLMEQLHEMEITSEALVQQRDTIHHQTLLKFLRDELKSGAEVPLEAFGAFEQKIARVKT